MCGGVALQTAQRIVTSSWKDREKDLLSHLRFAQFHKSGCINRVWRMNSRHLLETSSSMLKNFDCVSSRGFLAREMHSVPAARRGEDYRRNELRRDFRAAVPSDKAPPVAHSPYLRSENENFIYLKYAVDIKGERSLHISIFAPIRSFFMRRNYYCGNGSKIFVRRRRFFLCHFAGAARNAVASDTMKR